MHKLISKNLTSSKPLANFTTIYRKVTENIINGKPSANEKQAPEAEQINIEEPCEEEKKPTDEDRKKFSLKVLSPQCVLNNQPFSAMLTTSRKSFYSTNTNYKNVMYNKRMNNFESSIKLFKSTSSQDIEQCLKIRSNKSKTKSLHNNRSGVPRLSISKSVKKSNSSGKLKKHVKEKLYVIDKPEVRFELRNDELVRVDKKKFKIVYPTHLNKFRIGFFNQRNLSKRTNEARIFPNIGKNHTRKVAEKNNTKTFKNISKPKVKNCKIQRGRNNFDSVKIKKDDNTIEFVPSEFKSRLKKVQLMKTIEKSPSSVNMHPTLKQNDASAKMAINKRYNILLMKKQQVLKPPNQESKISRTKMEYKKRPIQMEKHCVTVSKTLANDIVFKHSRSLIEEKNENFDIDEICLKSNDKYISYNTNDNISIKTSRFQLDDKKYETIREPEKTVDGNESAVVDNTKNKATLWHYQRNIQTAQTKLSREEPKIIPAGPAKPVVQYLEKLNDIKINKSNKAEADNNNIIKKKLELYNRIDRQRPTGFANLLMNQTKKNSIELSKPISEYQNLLASSNLKENNETQKKIKQHKSYPQVMKKKYKNVLNNYIPKEIIDNEPVVPATPLKKKRFEQILNQFKRMSSENVTNHEQKNVIKEQETKLANEHIEIKNNKILEERKKNSLIKNEEVEIITEQDLMQELKSYNMNKIQTEDKNGKASNLREDRNIVEYTNTVQIKNNLIENILTKIRDLQELARRDRRSDIMEFTHVGENKEDRSQKIQNVENEQMDTNLSVKLPIQQSTGRKTSNEAKIGTINVKEENLENKPLSKKNQNLKIHKRKSSDPHDELDDPEVIVIETEGKTVLRKDKAASFDEHKNVSENRPTIRKERPPTPPSKPSPKKIPSKNKKELILPPQKQSVETKLETSKVKGKNNQTELQATSIKKEGTSDQISSKDEKKSSFLFQYLLTQKEPSINTSRKSENPVKTTDIKISELNKITDAKNAMAENTAENTLNLLKKPTLITVNQKLLFQHPNQVILALNPNGNKLQEPIKSSNESKFTNADCQKRCDNNIVQVKSKTKGLISKSSHLQGSLLHNEEDRENEKRSISCLPKKPTIISNKQKLSFTHSTQNEDGKNKVEVIKNNFDQICPSQKKETKNQNLDSILTNSNNENNTFLLQQKCMSENSKIHFNHIYEESEAESLKEREEKSNKQTKNHTKAVYRKLKTNKKAHYKKLQIVYPEERVGMTIRPQTVNDTKSFEILANNTYKLKTLRKQPLSERPITKYTRQNMSDAKSVGDGSTGIIEHRNSATKQQLFKLPKFIELKSITKRRPSNKNIAKNAKNLPLLSDSKLLNMYLLEEDEYIDKSVKQKNLLQMYMLEEDEPIIQRVIKNDKLNETLYPKTPTTNNCKYKNLLQLYMLEEDENIDQKVVKKTSNLSETSINKETLEKLKKTDNCNETKNLVLKSTNHNEKNVRIEMEKLEKDKKIHTDKILKTETTNDSNENTNKNSQKVKNHLLNTKSNETMVPQLVDKVHREVQPKIILKVILPKVRKELDISIGKKDEMIVSQKLETEDRESFDVTNLQSKNGSSMNNLETMNTNKKETTKMQNVKLDADKSSDIRLDVKISSIISPNQENKSLILRENGKPKYLLELYPKQYNQKSLKKFQSGSEIKERQNLLESYPNDQQFLTLDKQVIGDLKSTESKNVEKKYLLESCPILKEKNTCNKKHKYLLEGLNDNTEGVVEPELHKKVQENETLNLQNKTDGDKTATHEISSLDNNKVKREFVIKQAQIIENKTRGCIPESGKEILQPNQILSKGLDNIDNKESDSKKLSNLEVHKSDDSENSVAKTVSKIFIYLLKSRNKVPSDLFERKSRDNLQQILQKYKFNSDEMQDENEQKLSFTDTEMMKKKIHKKRTQTKKFAQKLPKETSTTAKDSKTVKPDNPKNFPTNNFKDFTQDIFEHDLQKRVKHSHKYLLERQLSPEFLYTLNKDIAHHELQNKKSSKHIFLFTNKNIDIETDYSHKYLLLNLIPFTILDQLKKYAEDPSSTLYSNRRKKQQDGMLQTIKEEYFKKLELTHKDLEMDSVKAEICEVLPQTESIYRKLYHKEHMYSSIGFKRSFSESEVTNLNCQESKDRLKNFNKKLFHMVMSNSDITNDRAYFAKSSEVKDQRKSMQIFLPKKLRREKHYASSTKLTQQSSGQVFVEKDVLDFKPQERKDKRRLNNRINLFSSLCFPFKSLSDILFSGQNEVTTLNKKFDDIICASKNIQADSLDKYKELKITYMQIKRPTIKENFVPLPPQAKERTHVLNERFTFLKNLYNDYKFARENFENNDSDKKFESNKNIKTTKFKVDCVNGHEMDRENNEFSKTIDYHKEVANTIVNINPKQVTKNQIEIFIKKVQEEDTCKEKKDEKEGENEESLNNPTDLK